MSWHTCGSYRDVPFLARLWDRFRLPGPRWRSAPQLETHNINNSIWLWRWWAGLGLSVCTYTPFYIQMDEVDREDTVTVLPLRDGMMELAASVFRGFWARCARDRPRRPSPRLSILMQTRSLSTQRGYISSTKDVLSPDTTHTVSNVLIQSCFVSLSLVLYESWVVQAWNNEEFTHTHGGALVFSGRVWYDVWIQDEVLSSLISYYLCKCILL